MNRKQAGEVNILARRLQEHLDTLAYPAQFPSCQEILEQLVIIMFRTTRKMTKRQ